MQTHLVVGFDPGVRFAGWAIVSRELSFVSGGLLKVPGVVDRRKIKGDLALEYMLQEIHESELCSLPVGLLAVEGQHLSRKHLKPMDIVRVGWVSGAMAGACRARVTKVANPGDWTGGVAKEVSQHRALYRAGESWESVAAKAGCTVAQASEVISALGIGQWAWKQAELSPELRAAAGLEG